jgi:hypothetical protein
LIKKHLHQSARFNGEYFVIEHRVGGLFGAVGGDRVNAIRIDSASGVIFQDGWDDISIHVLLEGFFEMAKALGEEYEQLSQRTVTVVCSFPVDPDRRSQGSA